MRGAAERAETWSRKGPRRGRKGHVHLRNVDKYLKRGRKEDGARLCSGARSQAETQKAPSKRQETLLDCESKGTVTEVAQKDCCCVIILDDTQKISGHGPDHPSLGSPT